MHTHTEWTNKLLPPSQVPIPITEGLDPLTLLTDDADVATWNNQGLPSDRMSTENATILCNTERWPLIVDAQLQGIKWIKNKYGSELKAIRLGQKRCGRCWAGIGRGQDCPGLSVHMHQVLCGHALTHILSPELTNGSADTNTGSEAENQPNHPFFSHLHFSGGRLFVST